MNLGIYQIRGASAIVTSASGIGKFINARTDSVATINIDKVSAPFQIAEITTSGNFIYKTIYSTVTGLDPVIFINARIATARYTLSGIFETAGPDAILFDAISVDNNTRLISSTLISTSSSINSPALTRTIIIVPSIANRTPTNIVQVPVATLIYDPAVI